MLHLVSHVGCRSRRSRRAGPQVSSAGCVSVRMVGTPHGHEDSTPRATARRSRHPPGSCGALGRWHWEYGCDAGAHRGSQNADRHCMVTVALVHRSTCRARVGIAHGRTVPVQVRRGSRAGCCVTHEPAPMSAEDARSAGCRAPRSPEGVHVPRDRGSLGEWPAVACAGMPRAQRSGCSALLERHASGCRGSSDARRATCRAIDIAGAARCGGVSCPQRRRRRHWDARCAAGRAFGSLGNPDRSRTPNRPSPTGGVQPARPIAQMWCLSRHTSPISGAPSRPRHAGAAPGATASGPLTCENALALSGFSELLASRVTTGQDSHNI